MSDKVCKWVALLRGVNVGGANKVAMAQLRELATGLGWGEVRSYIASGNLVFETTGDANGLARTLRTAMATDMDVDVPVLVLPDAQILAADVECPWDVKGNLVHVFFCLDAPSVDDALKTKLIASDEELFVKGNNVWFYAPSGVARSKLMAKMDRVLGVPTTARNLNTLRKLAEMVR